MFPSFRQRVMIVLGGAAAGWLAVWASTAARAADGTQGVTLLLAESPLRAVGWFLLVAAVASVIGAFVGAWGNPLAGLFTFAAALACGAVAGGDVEQWLRRAASSRVYLTWAAEAALWGLIVWAFGSICLELGERLRGKCGEVPETPAEPVPTASKKSRDPILGLIERARKLPAGQQTAGAAALGLIGGSVMVTILVPTSDIWQVVWGLVVAYALVGLATKQLFPKCHAMAILLSPLATATVWYTVIGLWGASGDAMLASHFAGRFWHAGLALPVHYASAGVAGAAVGIGWSQYLAAGAAGQEPGAASTMASGGNSTTS